MAQSPVPQEEEAPQRLLWQVLPPLLQVHGKGLTCVPLQRAVVTERGNLCSLQGDIGLDQSTRDNNASRLRQLMTSCMS